jgi:hypothetical protein
MRSILNSMWSVCIYNKHTEVHLLEIIILNLIKTHGKHSIKFIFFTFSKLNNVVLTKFPKSECLCKHLGMM